MNLVDLFKNLTFDSNLIQTDTSDFEKSINSLVRIMERVLDKMNDSYCVYEDLILQNLKSLMYSEPLYTLLVM